MNRALAAGLAAIVLGFAGYVLGVVWAYPGRESSLPLMMVGITMVVVGAGQRWSR